jgi:hypothetical protein
MRLWKGFAVGSLVGLVTAAGGPAWAQTTLPPPPPAQPAWAPSAEFVISTSVRAETGKKHTLVAQQTGTVCPSGQTFHMTRFDVMPVTTLFEEIYATSGNTNTLGRWYVRMSTVQTLPNGATYGVPVFALGTGYVNVIRSVPGGLPFYNNSIQFVVHTVEALANPVIFHVHTTGFCAVPRVAPARSTVVTSQ